MNLSADFMSLIATGFCAGITFFQLQEREYRMSLICLSATFLFGAVSTGYQNLGLFLSLVFGGLYFGTEALVAFGALAVSKETGWRHRSKYSVAICDWLLFLASIWYIIQLIVGFSR